MLALKARLNHIPLCTARIESRSGRGYLQIYSFFEQVVKRTHIFNGEVALFRTRYFWAHFIEILNWRRLH